MSKNTVNIWSSRGLSIYGKVTINHAKIYLQFLASADPKEIKKELNQMMKRIFHCNNGALRSFLRFSLEPFGGLFLQRYIFPLNSIPSYFNGGLSFEVFLIVEGNFNMFCGVTKRLVLIISPFSTHQKKNFLNKISFS